MEIKKSWISILLATFFLVALTAVLQIERTNFSNLFVAYSAAFASYLLLIKDKHLSFRSLLIIALIAHVIATFSIPQLSNDYYRFIWDGEMAWLKINPFDFRPVDLAHQTFIESSEYLQEVYKSMSGLSRRNYTVYPTINQFYFLISTAFTDSITANVIIMKCLLLLTEVLGFIYFIKLLKLLNLQIKRVWLIILNPLWIIEFLGNAHFEGTMICFLTIALYHLLKHSYFKGGLLFALAVQIKIIPLILLPFFIKFFGWKKALRVFAVIGVTVLMLALVYINFYNYGNFKKSLDLYFKSFEFNSFAIFHLVQLGKITIDVHTFRIFSSIFSTATFFIINYIALKTEIKDAKSLLTKMTIAYLIFLILGNSVHPWYILPLMFLSVFTNYSFAIIWSYLVFSTYVFYVEGMKYDLVFRTVVVVEYLVFFGVLWYEFKNRKPILTSFQISELTE